MVKHKIIKKDRTLKEMNLTRGIAIKIYCTECCGYEYNPKECDIKTCALWPFRGKSLAAF